MPRLRFSGLIRRAIPFCRILRHTRICGGSFLARILCRYIWYFGTQDKFELRQSLIIYGFTSRSRIFHSYGDVTIAGDWLFIVLRSAQEYFTYKERSPLAVKGCKSRRSVPLSREGSLSCHTCGFSGLIRSTAPFSRLLRHTRACGGSILARILRGPDCR
jgi:hypothetical protein